MIEETSGPSEEEIAELISDALGEQSRRRMSLEEFLIWLEEE